MQIIECVPNFSEGQDQETISQIAQAIKEVPEVKVIHQTSDHDHNRTVITFLGEPKAVVEAAFQAIKTAGQLIDLTKHQGVHPRIGATDVCPLIPLKNISFEDTIPYAEQLAERVAHELNIPTYLYEKAARIPERENLANIRRKGYEKTMPDYGTLERGPAGATVIGVREILVAYNVNLKSQDLRFAKKVARKIRESNGGFKYVKALGLKLASQGIVQISMNLTNYKVTPPHQVFKAIKAECDQAGIEILESELIGLLPADALRAGDLKLLKLQDFSEDRILDNHY